MSSHELSGVLVLYKPRGMTSHDCVNKIRRLFGTKKVGHTGTLDPDAVGVLPILIGRAAKAADVLLDNDKVYRAGLKLGLKTDTEDITGEVLSRGTTVDADGRTIYAFDDVKRVAADFVGEIMQVPPMYSALKRDGKKLVDLARQGIVVEREPRPVTIYSLEVSLPDRDGLSSSDKVDCMMSDRDGNISEPDYMLTVACSKGTYIRTLCADIGRSLGCGGVMCSLTRLKASGFDISDSVTLETLESLEAPERERLLCPVESLFYDYPALRLKPFFERLAHCGNELYQKKLGIDYPVGQRIRLYGEGGFFALGEVRSYPDGDAVKPIRLFVL
ncbi:MAG TPA: tRNA pseudouridine(55) synthase TruB [Firmicutes bacterium]|nr:tRNA pseudouridine(55) synthase TruB [Bacillota bacterium]